MIKYKITFVTINEEKVCNLSTLKDYKSSLIFSLIF